MSAKEMNLWKADYMIEPWGDERQDLRIATVVQSNLTPYTKKKIKLKDCMLDFEPVSNKPMDWRKLKSKLFARANAMNKRRKRK